MAGDPKGRADARTDTAVESFTNDFGWSVSRDRAFHECKRRYYYSYYGHWGGWDPDADPEARAIWLLKQVQSRHMWLGDIVHRTAAFALTFGRQNHELPPEDVLIERTDRLMREEFTASKADALRNGGETTTRLFEHEFPSKIAPSEWKTIHRKAIDGVRAFRHSEVVARALATKPEEWLSIEDFASFPLDDLTVRARLDFAFRDGADLRIVDWKTGARPGAPNRLQLACYVLYASREWDVPADRILATEVNLVRNEMREYRIEERDLEDARARIRESAEAMLRRLADAAANEARIEQFEPIKSHRVCRWCSFQRPCLGGTADEVLGRPRR